MSLRLLLRLFGLRSPHRLPPRYTPVRPVVVPDRAMSEPRKDDGWSNIRPVSPAAVASAQERLADLADPKAQMEAIALVAFETVPLLNKEEARLLYALEEAVREAGSSYRLMAQTSLGEIIQPAAASGSHDERRRAFASINSKRIDFTIFNRYGRLVIAIEYQGSGHYGQRSFMRDAVKREAVRKAGVPYLEIPKDFNRAKVCAQVRELLDAPVRSDPRVRPTGDAQPRPPSPTRH